MILITQTNTIYYNRYSINLIKKTLTHKNNATTLKNIHGDNMKTNYIPVILANNGTSPPTFYYFCATVLTDFELKR